MLIGPDQIGGARAGRRIAREAGRPDRPVCAIPDRPRRRQAVDRGRKAGKICGRRQKGWIRREHSNTNRPPNFHNSQPVSSPRSPGRRGRGRPAPARRRIRRYPMCSTENPSGRPGTESRHCSRSGARRGAVRQGQRRVAEPAAGVGLRGDEICRPGGVQDVLVAGMDALCVIAVQQPAGSLAVQNQGQFPRSDCRCPECRRCRRARRTARPDARCRRWKNTRLWRNLSSRRHWKV